MSNTRNEKKTVLRRARPVPTLLTVPDVRARLQDVDQPAADEVVLPPAEDASDIATTAMPTLDDLMAAASAPAVDSHPNESGKSRMDVWSDVKSQWLDRWFGGKFQIDLSTIGTILATVVACALVARAMRPAPVRDAFAAAAPDGAHEASDDAESRLVIAQAQPPFEAESATPKDGNIPFPQNGTGQPGANQPGVTPNAPRSQAPTIVGPPSQVPSGYGATGGTVLPQTRRLENQGQFDNSAGQPRQVQQPPTGGGTHVVGTQWNIQRGSAGRRRSSRDLRNARSSLDVEL